MFKQLNYIQPPNFVSCVVYKLHITVESQITIPGHNNLYRLCGIIYFSPNHFVCRIIDKCGGVWCHDGYEMGEEVEYIGNVVNLNNKDLMKHKRYTASLLVYTKLL